MRPGSNTVLVILGHHDRLASLHRTETDIGRVEDQKWVNGSDVVT